MIDLQQLQNADFEKHKKMLMRHARKRDLLESKNASDFYIEGIFNLAWTLGFTAVSRHRAEEKGLAPSTTER